MPVDADLAFTFSGGAYALKSAERAQAPDSKLNELLTKVSEAELYLALLNHGNFIEIAAEVLRLSEEQLAPGL